MSETLFSPSWYRVAALRPRLREHAEIHQHRYRGQVWYVLQDHAAARIHRFNPAAYCLIAQLDGSRSVDECWEAACHQLGDESPTQGETIQLLAQLHAADVLQCDVTPDTRELFRRHQKRQSMNWKRRLASPLALRFPLYDPQPLLDRAWPWVRPIFSVGGMIVWLALVASAIALAAMHWPDLSHDVLDRATDPENLLLLALVYPVLKVFHEFGHAFATKAQGGEVHEMGIMFLVLMPIPYVDASAASAFVDKRRRVLVGAAGIMVELALASVALFLWVSVEPGVVRTIAYDVMLIGGVSTVFFNGNPLLRFDGYYMLADAIEIPNLGARSNKYIGYLLQRYVLGVREARSPVTAPGERAWFVGYGIAAFVYRMFVICVITLFVAGKFFVIGVVLAIWAALTQLVVPLSKHLRFLLMNPSIRSHRLRAVATTILAVATLTFALFTVPLPLATRAQGVVWLPQQSQVRASVGGFVSRILVAPGSIVKRGDPLIETEDPLLTARVRVLRSKLHELETRYTALWRDDRVQAEIVKEAAAAARAELARAEEKESALVIRSPADGELIVAQAADLPGRFARQGDLVAYVLDRSRMTARVVVPQADIGMVRRHIEGIEVRLADRFAEPITATIARAIPGATHRLPSAALGIAGGGSIPVDPTNPEGTRALHKLFQFDLSVPSTVRTTGGRVYVRFDHGKEPLAQRIYRRGRQLFLRRFDV